jgi:hypothetical protein
LIKEAELKRESDAAAEEAHAPPAVALYSANSLVFAVARRGAGFAFHGKIITANTAASPRLFWNGKTRHSSFTEPPGTGLILPGLGISPFSPDGKQPKKTVSTIF